MESMLTLAEVASLLQVSHRTVYRLAQDGRIPAFKVGQAWRFRSGDIQAWIDAQVQTTGVEFDQLRNASLKGEPTR